MSSGPTLNEEYNALLVEWARQGCTAGPECEVCEKDLTDRHVHNNGRQWVCTDCFEQEGNEVDQEFMRSYDEDYEYVAPRGWRSREDGYEDFHSDG